MIRRLLLIFLFSPYQWAGAQSWDELNKEGLSLYNRAEYEKASGVMLKALEKAKTAHGTISEEYVSSINNLAYINQAKGNYSSAIDQFKESKDLTSQLYQSKTHIEYVSALNNIVNIYLRSGQYDSCETYVFQTIKVINDAYNNDKDYYKSEVLSFYSAYLSIRNSQASLYHKKGQLPEAIDVLKKELPGIRETYPDDYKQLYTYQIMLSNLATYYVEAGLTDQSKPLIEEYLDITADSEEDPISRVYAMQNLTAYYRTTGQIDSAEYISLNTLKYIEDNHLEQHEIFTILLNNLGEMYVESEDYDKSFTYLKKSREIQESRVSVNPNLYRTTLFNLAECYRWSGEYKKADELYGSLIKSLLVDIQQNFTYLSEQEKGSFFSYQLTYLEHYFSFALEISGALPIEGIPQNAVRPSITEDLYNTQLMMKASILNASLKMKSRIMTGDNEELKQTYKLWEAHKNYLASLRGSAATTQQEVEFHEDQVESLEKVLTLRSRQFTEGFVTKNIQWQDVQQKLKPGEVAVEMIRLVDGLIYGALIITTETTLRPQLALVMSTRSKHLEREFYKKYENSVRFKLKDTTSYSVYFQPVVNTIIENMPGNTAPEKVYFSPDGIYNQINLNTLFDTGSNEYVLDKFEIVPLTNTKELVTSTSTSGERGINKAVLFGRPSFSISDDSQAQATFTDLVATGIEVNKIEKYLQRQNWSIETNTGEKANETNLKTLKSPKVLHLATHGFFEDNQNESQTSVREILLNSGIALAGANDKEGHQGENGIFTAYEALNLSLDSTDLVVLSACETGLGQIHPGEGVYGLQRALKCAGAKSIIMSLWKVDDQATQELMVQFYEHWSVLNDKRAAFRKAQFELRKKYPEPYYWGAFVMTGI